MSLAKIFNNASYEVYVQEALPSGKNETWIMFGSYSSREPAGKYLLQQRGCKAIHIVSIADDWYQGSDLLDVFVLVKAILRGSSGRLVAFGGSMGGFGAIACSGALPFDVVIAGAPQTMIDVAITRPHDTRWDRNWEKLKLNGLSMPDAAKAASGVTPIYAIFDPRVPEDLWHVQRLESLPNVTLVPIPSAGHEVLNAMKRLPLWQKFLTTLVTKRRTNTTYDTVMKQIRKGVWKSRRITSGYFLKMGQALFYRKKFLSAVIVLRAGIKKYPKDTEIYYWLSNSLQHNGDHSDAVKMAKLGVKSIKGREIFWQLHERLAHSYAAIKDEKACRLAYNNGISEFPNNINMLFSFAEYLGARLDSEAIYWADRALNVNPSIPSSVARSSGIKAEFDFLEPSLPAAKNSAGGA